MFSTGNGCRCSESCATERACGNCAFPRNCEACGGKACGDERDKDCDRGGRLDGGGREGAVLPPDGVFRLRTFALYAEHSLRLGACAEVEGGDIGVRSRTDEPSGAQLTIGGRGPPRLG